MADAPDFRALCAGLLDGLDRNRHPEVRYPGHLRTLMAKARAILARYGSPAPVPKGDPLCRDSNFHDDQGRCWCGIKAFVCDYDGKLVKCPPSWELREPSPDKDDAFLPHWAIPLPEGGGMTCPITAALATPEHEYVSSGGLPHYPATTELQERLAICIEHELYHGGDHRAAAAAIVRDIRQGYLGVPALATPEPDLLLPEAEG